MKLYLFDTINRYKRYSETLDVKTKICNRPWIVFNDGGEKEVYKFKEDGTINIVLSGRVTRGTWEYDPTDKTIIISASDQSYMVHPGMYDDMLLALQVDGTNECSFLIEENNSQDFAPKTYSELMLYFEEKEMEWIEYEKNKEKIEMEKQRKRKEELEQMIISDFLLFINDKPIIKLYNYVKKIADLFANTSGCTFYFFIFCFIIWFVCRIIYSLPDIYGYLIILLFMSPFIFLIILIFLIYGFYSKKIVNDFIKTSPYKDIIDYALREKLENMFCKE